MKIVMHASKESDKKRKKKNTSAIHLGDSEKVTKPTSNTEGRPSIMSMADSGRFFLMAFPTSLGRLICG